MRVERWLITGAAGQLGGHLVRHLATDSHAPHLLALIHGRPLPVPNVPARAVDLADPAALRTAVVTFDPTHILHVGALTAVGVCHADPAAATRINVDATAALADAAATVGARFVFTSTDMVFDGIHAPYSESDLPNPLSYYGRTKVSAERVLRDRPQTVIVRLPLLYGFPVDDRPTTFAQQMAAVRANQPLRLFTDEFRTPLALPDAAQALIGLARSDFSGVLHVAGPERLSRYDLVARCAALLGYEQPELVRITRADLAAPEPRPADLSLNDAEFRRRFPELAARPLRAEALQR